MFDFDFSSFLDMAATAVSAYSSYADGKEAKRVADSNAAAELESAALDKQRATDAKARGVQEADQADQRKRALLGKQTAAMGASGIVAGEGSFANLLSDTESAGQADESTIMHNAISEAWGYSKRADSETKQAAEYRRAGSAAEDSGLIKGIGSLVAGTFKTGETNGRWKNPTRKV